MPQKNLSNYLSRKQNCIKVNQVDLEIFGSIQCTNMDKKIFHDHGKGKTTKSNMICTVKLGKPKKTALTDKVISNQQTAIKETNFNNWQNQQPVFMTSH